MARGVILLAALVAGRPDEAAKEPTYNVVPHKAADAVVTRKEKDRTVFVVTSKSGIGGADIVPGRGWPEKVTFRFLSADGKAFTSLENIRLYTDRVMIQGSHAASGKMPFRFVGAGGKFDAIEPGGPAAAGLLDVRVDRRAAGMDLTLPDNLLRGSDKLRLTWIDAFRR